MKPRYAREAGPGSGVGLGVPGYVATADPLVKVADQTWGIELVLPEALEYTVRI